MWSACRLHVEYRNRKIELSQLKKAKEPGIARLFFLYPLLVRLRALEATEETAFLVIVIVIVIHFGRAGV